MAYSPKLAAFVYKASWDAITKYKADKEDASALADLVSNLAEFRGRGIITDAQLDALSNYLGVQVVVPDAPDTYEENLAAIEQIANTATEIANTTANDQVILSDAIADLSEVVSSLVPTV